MNILGSAITWFASIPDVVWAAIVASGLTFFGVTLSNRANRKSLLLQLNHAAQEKDKENELQIRKDVYMEAAEAIAESIKDIQLLPNRIIYTDNLEICNKLLQALAKVHMVGSLDTVKHTIQFMGKFNQSTIPLIPEIHKFAVLKQEIASLVRDSEIKVNFMKEINKDFQQRDSNSKQNILDIYTKQIDDTEKENEAICDEIKSKETEQKNLHTKLLSLCLEAGMYLQKESLNVILSIRKELNLEMDSEKYLSCMEEMFKKYEGFFNQENVEKLIRG